MGRQILFIRNMNSLHTLNSYKHQEFMPSPMLLLQQLSCLQFQFSALGSFELFSLSVFYLVFLSSLDNF